MIIYVNNDTNDGIYAKIKLEIIDKFPPWESDQLGFYLWNESGWFDNDYSDHNYHNIQPYNDDQTAFYEGLYCAFSFDATFDTPSGVKVRMWRDRPTDPWNVINGDYSRGLNAIGIRSYGKGFGEYKLRISNFFLYLIKIGNVSNEKMLCTFPAILPNTTITGGKSFVSNQFIVQPSYEITTQCSGY